MSGIALLLAFAQTTAPGRFARAEFALTGPLESARFEIAERAVITLDARLAPGEVRWVTLPIPHARDGRELDIVAPRVVAGEAEPVRWLGWSREEVSELESAWEQLPLGLRRRAPVDPLQRDERRSALGAAMAALAVFTCTLALRKRLWVALAVSMVGSAAVVAVFFAPPSADETLRVLEGDGESGRWIAVDVAWERWRGPSSAPLWFATVPEHAVVEAHLDLAAPGAWSLTAARTVFRRTTAVEPGARSLDARHNRWGAFDDVWTRTADGIWRAHGPWEAGRALAEGVDGAPPGRFNPGLPQGLAVVIARLAPGTFAGFERAAADGAPTPAVGGTEAPAGEVWLRWVGPPSPESR